MQQPGDAAAIFNAHYFIGLLCLFTGSRTRKIETFLQGKENEKAAKTHHYHLFSSHSSGDPVLLPVPRRYYEG